MRITFVLFLFSLFVQTTVAQDVKLYSEDGTYLGKVSDNKYDPESISNPYGRYGSQYSSESVNNSYGRYGSKYSSESSNNEYTNSAPKMYGDNEDDNEYLGRLSKNKYDSESSSNEYGKYGSKYSNTSINNPYSQWYLNKEDDE